MGVPTPALDDLLNTEPFVTFANWCDEREILTPVGNTISRSSPGVSSAALGRQAGAMKSKRALPALFCKGLGAEGNLSAALEYVNKGKLPFDVDAQVPLDLEFAAERTVANATTIKEFRVACNGSLRELSHRLKPVSAHLRRFQGPSTSSVARNMHVALIAVLAWLLRWPDVTLALRFITGFRLSGRMEKVGIFPERDSVAPLEPADVLRKSEEWIRRLQSERTSPDAKFLYDSCKKETESGWASTFLNKVDLDRNFGVGGWAPIPAFVVTQSCGKQRRIDNAKKCGHNLLQAPVEEFRMCNAFQPALCAKALLKAAGGEIGPDLRILSGGEDLPNAYRSLPVAEEDLRFNVLAVRNPETNEMEFMIAYALLFGWASSVWGFARYSTFLEACARRLMCLLHASYVDDSELVDLEASGSAGQEALCVLFKEIGTPTAPGKQQSMSPEGCFLGVNHDVSRAWGEEPTMRFWPKEKLVEKILGKIDAAERANSFPPGEASKLRGMLGFTADAMMHGVGQAALGSLKQRQFTDVEPFTLSNSLRRSFDYFKVILSVMPRRVICLRPPELPPILVASDARADQAGEPTGGYILIDQASGRRTARFCVFNGDLLELWGFPRLPSKKKNPIALCEGGVIPLALLEEAPFLKNRRLAEGYIMNEKLFTAQG